MELERSAEAFGNLLDAAEAASPVEAVEAVTRAVGLALGATSVSFLIADLSGRGLVRLAHVPLSEGDDEGLNTPLRAGERRDIEEHADLLHFDGGPPEQALRTQEVQVLAPGSTRARHTPRPVAGARPGDRAWRGDRTLGVLP